MAMWGQVSPRVKAYANEADALGPEWLQSFWGAHYEKLLTSKSDRNCADDGWVWGMKGQHRVELRPRIAYSARLTGIQK